MMPRRSITLHIVDDDTSVRKALERVLRSAGYYALTYESAEDFLDATSGRGEGCLILDIRLPGITGLDLQDQLASWEAKYSVIFITAHDDPDWRERARKAGAVAFLKKPFNDHLLLDAIDLACGKPTTTP
jgi:FixJ family two-component response regulator